MSNYGAWWISEDEYVAEVRRYADEIGYLEWVAPMDYMCEPEIIAGDARRGWPGTHLSVPEHQRRTVDNFVRLRDRLGELVVPVLQGWEPDEYLRCVDLYEGAGVDLLAERFVGVGSVCRRQATGDAVRVFRTIAEAGIRAHGFGVKTAGLYAFSDLLVSADSMSWSFTAKMEGLRRKKSCDFRNLPSDHPDRFGRCGKRSCSNCLHRALEYRSGIVEQISLSSRQLRLEAP